MMLVWSRKSCLGLPEIASFVFLVLFKDDTHMLTPRFHLFVSEVNQGNKDASRGGFKIFLHGLRDELSLLGSFASC